MTNKLDIACQTLKDHGFEQVSSREFKSRKFFRVYVGAFRVVLDNKSSSYSVDHLKLEKWLKKHKILRSNKTTKPKD